MAKYSTKTVFLCAECGEDFPKWHGKCPACNEWGTLKEYTVPKDGRPKETREARGFTPLSDIIFDEACRTLSGIPELDRVLGGGFLSGSMILLGGTPGIGKSTLALQAVASLGAPVLYVSAEENEEQIALRARRLEIGSANLSLTGENRWEAMREQLFFLKAKFFVIDSIQTIYAEGSESLPGAIGQVRECGQKVLELCKSHGVTAIVIGHVTKEGIIAGPRMLEHMADTVLYLEGDSHHDYRILRAVKNRFGPTNEVGVFEMSSEGLLEVKNPSHLFLSERKEGITGSAVFPSMEGSRPILVEVQALVSNANFGTPQRNVTGFDIRRLSMLLAVLEKRLGFLVGTKDVFVNCVGGMRIDEPAADLAVIAAIASSLKDEPLPANGVLIGEIGLAGELRSISHLDKRIQEARQLGFKTVLAPMSSVNKSGKRASKIVIHGVRSVDEAFTHLFK